MISIYIYIERERYHVSASNDGRVEVGGRGVIGEMPRSERWQADGIYTYIYIYIYIYMFYIFIYIYIYMYIDICAYAHSSLKSSSRDLWSPPGKVYVRIAGTARGLCRRSVLGVRIA